MLTHITEEYNGTLVGGIECNTWQVKHQQSLQESYLVLASKRRRHDWGFVPSPWKEASLFGTRSLHALTLSAIPITATVAFQKLPDAII